MEELPSMAPQVGDRTPYSRGGSKLKITRASSSGRTATPYQRPEAAARHPALPPERKGWIGEGIVGSASRILTNGATFLFTSLFKRRRPAIAAPPQANAEVELDEAVPCLELALPSNEQVTPAADYNDARYENGPCDPIREGDTSQRLDAVDAADVENLLLEKELTREQCERYIKLIRSRFHEEDRPSKPLPLPSPSVSRAPHWTPIQSPIRGGRELLKKRDTADALSPLARGTKDLSPSSSRSFRGPSILPSAAHKRKTNSETMDLTCFRKTKERTGFKLSAPLQSTRTAGRILNTLERSPFKDLELAKTPETDFTAKQRVEISPAIQSPAAEGTSTAKTKRGGLPPLHKLSASSSFSFQVASTRAGPEPPTPKIPSPTGGDRDYSKANGTASDVDNYAARVEKASAILDGNFGGAPGPVALASGFEAGSSSSRFVTSDDDDKFYSALLASAKEKEFSLADGPWTKSEKFLVGAQSPAPPDSNPPNSSNGGFSVVAGPEKISKRKKSAKRMR